jgi:micrococcal nuclease
MKLNIYILCLLVILPLSSCRNNRINQFPQLNASKKRASATNDGDRNSISTDTLSIKQDTITKPADPVPGDAPLVSVTRVIDGDTFAFFNLYGSEEKVRLIGVNAPESRNTGKKRKEAFGEESKKYLTDLLKGKRVRLEYDVQRIDKYGRTLAYVYMENGIFLNEYLVKKGYCQVATFPPNVKYKDLFIEAERYARAHKEGLWH